MSKEIEYTHRDLKEAIFGLTCLAYLGVKDKTLIENLNADCSKELEQYDDLKKRYSKLFNALEIIKELFDFDFAIRFGNNQPMLMITNKKTKEYWELPISKENQDLLKEVLL